MKVSKAKLAVSCFLALFMLFFSLMALGGDSTLFTSGTTKNIPNVTPTAMGGSSSACSYYFSDIYQSTAGPSSPINAGSYDSDNSTQGIITYFYNNLSPSEYSSPLPCSGTYRILFTIDFLWGTLNGTNAIALTPNTTVLVSIYTQGGTQIYYANVPNDTDAFCGKTSYQTNGTAYCGLSHISTSATVYLNQGDSIEAPIVYPSAPGFVTGGYFIAYLVSSP